MLNLEGSVHPTIGRKDELAGRVYVPSGEPREFVHRCQSTLLEFNSPFSVSQRRRGMPQCHGDIRGHQSQPSGRCMILVKGNKPTSLSHYGNRGVVDSDAPWGLLA
jgi:hypothetical protein